ncbi:MAG: acetoacetate--CoA ligase [Actinomycetota bacterium]
MMTPLWTPSAERIADTEIDRFRRSMASSCADSGDLWRWSVDEPGAFWRAVWDWSGVIGAPGEALMVEGPSFRETTFLPGATLNVAENLLAGPDDRPGAVADDEIVIAAWVEDGESRSRTRAQLRAEVAATAAAFRAAGVGPGDRVAAWMPHCPETVIAFLAAASIGAVFTSTSADFGTDGVVDRFGQIEPTVLVAADAYRYGGKEFDCLERLAEIRRRLPSVVLTLVVGHRAERPDLDPAAVDGDAADDAALVHWADAIAANAGAEPRYEPLPFDHPLYVLYSSGTTGKPKCIVHRAGGVLLKHFSELRLHSDIRPGDRVFFFTTCGWMMWNWLVSALGVGAAIVLYDGNPQAGSPGRLFDIGAEVDATLLGVSAKYIDGVMKSGDRPGERLAFASLRTICSTGSPLSPEGFDWVHDAVAADVHLVSMSGGTDLCGCLVMGDPTRPVYSGEIQAKALGVAADVFDDDGTPASTGEKGELVCTRPFPSMPLHFWGDDDGSRYRGAYFERFGDLWAHGDYAAWTERGGMIIYGRSDATLNASGVRIGTAEIYRVVEQLDEVAEAIAIGQQWDGDTRVVLFVRLADGADLDEDLIGRIRADLRAKCSPRHVPAVVAAVPDIPRTRSGKIVELAVTEVVHGRPVKNIEALANPEALDHFAARPELA